MPPTKMAIKSAALESQIEDQMLAPTSRHRMDELHVLSMSSKDLRTGSSLSKRDFKFLLPKANFFFG